MSRTKIPQEYNFTKMGDRMRFAFDKIPGSREEQARAVGLSGGTKVSALVGDYPKKIRGTTLVAIEYRSGIRAEWIKTGLGSPFIPAVMRETASKPGFTIEGNLPIDPTRCPTCGYHIAIVNPDEPITIVSGDEMCLIHRLLHILRSTNEKVIAGITINLELFTDLVHYAKEFATIISLERRTREDLVDFDNRRKAITAGGDGNPTT